MRSSRGRSSHGRDSGVPDADARDPSNFTTSTAGASEEDSVTTGTSSPSAGAATAAGTSSGRASSEPAPDPVLLSSIASLEKRFGKGIAFIVGSRLWRRVRAIPTGLPNLDLALGVLGIPLGRLTEIFGPDSSGKTTLALHIARQCQMLGANVLYVDTEHSLDLRYATALGLNMQRMVLTQPDYAEQAFAVMTELMEKSAVGLVILDSVAMLMPKAEFEGEIGDAMVGLQPRLLAQGLRKLIPLAMRNGVALVFLNQIREKVGVSWGQTETTPGGRALRHMASIRLDVRRVGKIVLGDLIVGNRVRVTVAKNKLATPLAEAELDLYYGEGFCPACSLLEAGLAAGVLHQKPGGWVAYGGTDLVRGREAFRSWLREHLDVAREIYMAIVEKYGLDYLLEQEAEE
jgi:recombination protein RecA